MCHTSRKRKVVRTLGRVMKLLGTEQVMASGETRLLTATVTTIVMEFR